MATKLGVLIVSLLITGLVGAVFNKLFAPGGSFLGWSDRDLFSALALVLAIPAIFVVTYIGVSQRLQNTTTKSALVESLLALLLIALVVGLGLAFVEWRERAYRSRLQKQRLVLSQSSPYAITAIDNGVVTARSADGKMIETTHALFLYAIAPNDTDVPIVEEALRNEVKDQQYQLLLNGDMVSMPRPKNGIYKVPPRSLTIIDHENNPITTDELLDRVLERVGAVRYYDELVYQLESSRNYERHYADVYLESETGDTIIYNARVVRCEGEETACESIRRILSSGINYNRISRKDYLSKLRNLALVSRPVVLTGIETPEGFVVHKIKLL